MYTLILALFGKTDGMISSLLKMEEMKNAGMNFGLDTEAPEFIEPKDCYQIPIPCELLAKANMPIRSLQMEVIESPPLNENFGVRHERAVSAADNDTNVETTTAILENEDDLTTITDDPGGGTTLPPPTTTTPPWSELDSWVENMTRLKEENETCDECIERCGDNCKPLCSIFPTCSSEGAMSIVGN